MKDRSTLLKEIEVSLQDIVDLQLLERIIDKITFTLHEYEVTERCTEIDLYDDENERILKRYVACMYVDGRSPNTIDAYIYRIRDFLKISQKKLKEIGTYDIRFYLGLLKQRGNCNSTVEGARSYIAALYKWMTMEDLITKNPCDAIKPIKCNSSVRVPFSELEIERIRNSCKDLRERALVEILLTTGVRVSELVNLDIEDVNFANNTVHVRHGKGDKDRVTFMSSVAAYHLKRYLVNVLDPNKSTGELFRSSTGRLKPGGVRFILKNIEERSGVPNIHPHRFRHTFATLLNNKGMQIQHIQSLLGHSRIDTTMVYVNIDKNAIHSEYKKLMSNIGYQ